MTGFIIFILIVAILFYFYYKNRAEKIKRIERFNSFVNNFGEHREEFQKIKEGLFRMQIKMDENKKGI